MSAWPDDAPEAAPGLYRLCMQRLRLGELWRMSPNAPTALLGIVLIKVFRMSLGNHTIVEVPMRLKDVDDVGEHHALFVNALERATEELLALGFRPVWTFTQASELATPPSIGRAFLSEDGRTLAQRLIVEQAEGTDVHTKVGCSFSSGVDRQSRIWTVDLPRDIDSPHEPRTERVLDKPSTVWAHHQERLATGDGPYPVLDEAIVRAMINIDNAGFCNHAIARGLYRPLPAAPNKA